MKTAIINLYSSATDQNQRAFVATMAMNMGRAVQLLPLAAMPAPDPLRRQRLRVEQGDLLQAIEAVEAHLSLFTSGELQPDAGRENGLHFTLESLKSRLKGVNAVLSSVEIGGQDNG